MRVLVTGASGLVGSNVAAAAAQQSWDVLGCFGAEPVELEGVRTVGVEMADRRACVAAAMEFEPDVVVHAAGGVALSRFEREPYIAQLDYVGAEHTLAAARAVRAHYVLVSCDWVHSGYRPAGVRFGEADLPDPVNAYGRSKLACEEATMRSNVRWLITRPGEVYGVNVARPADGERGARYVWERSGLALRIVARLRERTPLPAPVGVWRCPTYAWDYAQRVCELIAQGCEGVYNTAGPVALGRRDWLELLGGAWGCGRELVPEGTTAAFLHACGEDPHLKLPSNVALSDEKARAAIGVAAVAPERGLRLMREQLRHMLVPAGVQAR
ncbi:MAG: sugar nucleotide-binding protein [Solirubrobacteraceae bacterium]